MVARQRLRIGCSDAEDLVPARVADMCFRVALNDAAFYLQSHDCSRLSVNGSPL